MAFIRGHYTYYHLKFKMILVASASKPLSYTMKKTARRGVILKDYNEEIEAIYRAVEDSSNTNIPIPSGSSSGGGWTLEESSKFVRDVVHSIMISAESLGDEDDFFGFGCDRWVIGLNIFDPLKCSYVIFSQSASDLHT